MDTIVYKANQPILSYSSDERHMNASKKIYIYIYNINGYNAGCDMFSSTWTMYAGEFRI